MLALVDVPEHGSAVLATRSDQRTVGGDSEGVDDTGMSHEVGSELAVGEIPDLDDLVPTSRNDEGLLGGRRESDARNPVVVIVLLNGVLALAQGVPELDGLVTSGRDDLSVVSREANREHIALVGEERSNRLSLVEIPQSQSLVPRTRQGISTIGRKNNIRNSTVVTGQSLSGITIGLALGGELPNDDLLVTRRGDNGVGVGEGSGDSSDAVVVSLKITSVDQLNHSKTVTKKGRISIKQPSEKMRKIFLDKLHVYSRFNHRPSSL